ncbi:MULTISPECIES: antirestriction Ral family protein [Enterobacteriaceae]|nr:MULTISPECIES: antirestriction Ral family protein [Enterobacteriaceae]MCE0528975.1 hypothetical protein [Escherichia coli]MCF1571508.1 hypothetical protein [Escherichia coli]MCI3532752.1 hypothetical protein [Escherichia coli]MCK0893465.1 hypothetical protein [Escherichia coli]MCK3644769.1 hypothetical protein [Escherichia coli]
MRTTTMIARELGKQNYKAA